MDPFTVGVLVIVAAAALATCLAARANRGKPLAEFGNRHRHAGNTMPAVNVLEEQDLSEMLAVTNARRRVRGLPERSRADAIREFGGS